MMNNTVRRLQRIGIVTIGAAIVVACSSNGSQTLGQLKYEAEKEKEIEFEKLSHEEVRKEYKELIDLFEDKRLKEQIERRIADVYMMEAVDTEQQESSQYVEAIKAYRNVLERYPNSPDNAEVFYQLAKAYDLEGQQDEAMKMLTELVNRHPNYKNIAEVHFRKADIHFNWQQYRQAKASYRAVTQLAQDRLLLNAKYMLGWVHYKEVDFEDSVASFAFVLNSVLQDRASLEGLDKAERPLVEDSIHSMSLAVDKLGGVESIANLQDVSGRNYVWMLYDYLGDYYLEKELYEQSADTFRHFVRNFGAHSQAPNLHNKLIAAYVKGAFPRQALEEKENYIGAYGIRGSYPGNANGIAEEILASLNTYLEEIARFNYTEGQAVVEAVAKEKEKKGSSANQKLIAKGEGEAIDYFRKAASFYGEFIDTFPAEARVDEMRFLKAESHFLAGDFLDAAQAYEQVAYTPVGTSAQDKAADAGYAAIISYQNHIENLGGEAQQSPEVTSLRATAVESMLRFSSKFDTDERSPTVLTNAAEYLFGLDQYERAISVAQELVAKPTIDRVLKKTAFGIMAHSYFKLDRFAEAEQSYISQRQLVEKGTDEYTQISERIATSVFKNAETIEKSEGALASANELLKIKRLSPDSPIRITAQYDAASLLMSVEEWPRAIAELRELIVLYPEHELAVEFPRKLALAYQKNEDWADAASAYMVLFEKDPDSEIKREALYVAATMYENAKQYETAIDRFKQYARTYEQPFDTRMEARYHLAINYERLGDTGKKLYWLRRIIDGDAKGGAQRTERSQYLGAWANAEYGDYFASEFRKYRLYQPLNQSIAKKQEFFKDALDRYQKSADYGILEFVTMSSYKIGGLYEAFAGDLREVPPPGGLSASDRELYAGIIEEQATPMDQTAVEAYQANIDRAWEGEFNTWIDQSFAAITRLYPERYNKQEVAAIYGDEIR